MHVCMDGCMYYLCTSMYECKYLCNLCMHSQQRTRRKKASRLTRKNTHIVILNQTYLSVKHRNIINTSFHYLKWKRWMVTSLHSSSLSLSHMRSVSQHAQVIYNTSVHFTSLCLVKNKVPAFNANDLILHVFGQTS